MRAKPCAAPLANSLDNASLNLVRFDPMQIGSIYPAHNEDRILVKLDDVPPLLVKALIAVEDRDFYEHNGIAPRAMFRALFANLRAGGKVQGGSTITQQLVKNFFLSNERTFTRKTNEIIMALAIERRYDKTDIMESYLNEIYLGQDGARSIHGFGLASQFYFARPLKELLGPLPLLRGPGEVPAEAPELRRERLVVQRRLDDGPETQQPLHPRPGPRRPKSAGT